MDTGNSIILPVALGIIMFGIGINLKFSNFKTVFIAPKAVITGLIGQMILLPLIGFSIAALYPVDNTSKFGLVLIAACPGGTASNLVTFMLKGRVALSVALTAFNSFLILFTVPFVLNIGTRLFLEESKWVEIGYGYVLTEISVTVLLPVFAGMLFNHRFPELTSKLRKPLRYILPGILFAVFAYVLLIENQNGEENLLSHADLIIPALLLNVLTMITGYYFSGAAGITHTGKYTIAIEMGLQNSALAIFLAHSVLKQPDVAVAAVVYGSFSFFITLGIAYIMQVKGK